MSHFEGPIVDSFYEIALHSWYNRLSPPLPCMSTPYKPPRDKSGRIRYLFQDHNPYFDDIEILKAARAARLLLKKQTRELDGDGPQVRERFRDTVKKAMEQRRHTLADWTLGEELETRRQLAVEQLEDFKDRWGLSGVMMGRTNSSRGLSRRSSALVVPSAANGGFSPLYMMCYTDKWKIWTNARQN